MATPKSGQIGGVSNERVRSIVSRILQLKSEIVGLNNDVADIYDEARSNGDDIPALKALISEIIKKEKNPTKFEELGSWLEVYRRAYFGCDSDEREAA